MIATDFDPSSLWDSRKGEGKAKELPSRPASTPSAGPRS